MANNQAVWTFQDTEKGFYLDWDDADNPHRTTMTFTILSGPSHGTLESYNDRNNSTAYPDLYFYTSEMCSLLVTQYFTDTGTGKAREVVEELDRIVGPHANVAAALLRVAGYLRFGGYDEEALSIYYQIAERWPTEEAGVVALGKIASHIRYYEGRQARNPAFRERP